MKTIGASIIGASHLAEGLPCQDFSWFEMIGAEWIGVLADGAGSAKHAEKGSALTVAFIMKKLRSVSSWREISEEEAKKWVEKLRKKIESKANSTREGSIQDFACTLLFARASKEGGIFFHLGDGAWVIDNGRDLLMPTKPFHGEYATTTTFVTSSDAVEKMQFCIFTNPIAGIAGMSDGIEFLSIETSKNKPHPEFFAPLFRKLRSNMASKNIKDLQRNFKLWLKSKTICDRTDDDKTLLLVTF